MERAEKMLVEQLSSIAEKQREDLISQVKTAIDNNDIKAIGLLKIKYSENIASTLTEIQRNMFEIGKKSAATEMEVAVPPTNKEVRGAIKVQNTNIADDFARKQKAIVINTVTEIIGKRGGDIKKIDFSVIGTVTEKELKKMTKANILGLKTLTVVGSVNTGRTSIFERYPEEIHSMQYSAIMDNRTSAHCMSLDGRVVKAGSSDFYAYSPPQHYNCRSIWVEILKEEEFKPVIRGIPKSITPTKTIDSAQLLKNPIILKNSAAVKIIQTEIATRQEKLTKLIRQNKHPKRQKAHQAKIQQLKISIRNKFGECQNAIYDELKLKLI